MGWTDNPIMEWSTDQTTWHLISDHGRSPLTDSPERFEFKSNMFDGTLRKYVVAKKHRWSVSWENIPDKQVSLLTNGKPGGWMENFYLTHDDMFYMRIREGDDIDTDGSSAVVYKVMLSDFSKDIVRRTPTFDLWNIDLSIEEV